MRLKIFKLSGGEALDHDGAGGDDVRPVPGAAALLLPPEEGAPGRLLPHHESHPGLLRVHCAAL